MYITQQQLQELLKKYNLVINNDNYQLLGNRLGSNLNNQLQALLGDLAKLLDGSEVIVQSGLISATRESLDPEYSVNVETIKSNISDQLIDVVSPSDSMVNLFDDEENSTLLGSVERQTALNVEEEFNWDDGQSFYSDVGGHRTQAHLTTTMGAFNNTRNPMLSGKNSMLSAGSSIPGDTEMQRFSATSFEFEDVFGSHQTSLTANEQLQDLMDKKKEFINDIHKRLTNGDKNRKSRSTLMSLLPNRYNAEEQLRKNVEGFVKSRHPIGSVSIKSKVGTIVQISLKNEKATGNVYASFPGSDKELVIAQVNSKGNVDHITRNYTFKNHFNALKSLFVQNSFHQSEYWFVTKLKELLVLIVGAIIICGLAAAAITLAVMITAGFLVAVAIDILTNVFKVAFLITANLLLAGQQLGAALVNNWRIIVPLMVIGALVTGFHFTSIFLMAVVVLGVLFVIDKFKSAKDMQDLKDDIKQLRSANVETSPSELEEVTNPLLTETNSSETSVAKDTASKSSETILQKIFSLAKLKGGVKQGQTNLMNVLKLLGLGKLVNLFIKLWNKCAPSSMKISDHHKWSKANIEDSGMIKAGKLHTASKHLVPGKPGNHSAKSMFGCTTLFVNNVKERVQSMKQKQMSKR